MRILFMGTPDIAAESLAALLGAGHEVCAVFTRRDKPVGRKQILTAPPVKQLAMERGIPVYQPAKVRDASFVEVLQGMEADVYVVIAFGQILPKEILEMTPYGCVNVHASLLPKYRGAAPIQWAVIDGEKVSGVTTMQMDEGLDTGDMLLKTEIVLDDKETGGSLHDKLAEAGAGLCVETLKGLEEHTIVPQKQGDSPTAYARMLDKNLGNIDWNKSAEEIERLIRGLNPWPSAYTDWNGKVMKIWEAEVCEEDTKEASGTVVRVEKDGFLVQTGKGLLKVTALQIPGKKRMEADAFLRGYDVKIGTVLKNS